MVLFRQESYSAVCSVTHGGVAERLGSGLQSRPHGFESRRHLTSARQFHQQHPGVVFTHATRAIGAAVARFPDTEEVTGSIPVSPTTESPRTPGGFRRSSTCRQRKGTMLQRVMAETTGPQRRSSPWRDGRVA